MYDFSQSKARREQNFQETQFNQKRIKRKVTVAPFSLLGEKSQALKFTPKTFRLCIDFLSQLTEFSHQHIFNCINQEVVVFRQCSVRCIREGETDNAVKKEIYSMISCVFWYALVPFISSRATPKYSNNTQKDSERLCWHSIISNAFSESPTIHLTLFLLVDETL